MRLSLRVLSSIAAAALLGGCGGGGGSHTMPTAYTPSGGGNAPAAAFRYGRQVLVNATPAGPAKLGTMKIDVQVQPANAMGLKAYAQSVGTPGSALYRHFLTPAEIGQRFGASDANYNAAIAYFQSYGLQVGGWTQKLLLRVVGPQANMEKAFGTTFQTYTTHNGPIYGPSSMPHFSRPLAITSVSHLVWGMNWTKRNSVKVPPHGITPGFQFGDPPQPLQAAFDYNGAYASGYTGQNINIGIVGTGPIEAADYQNYVAAFGTMATNTVTQVNVAPGTPALVQGPGGGGSPAATPPPTTDQCNGALPACNPEDFEAQIDTQQTAALAPSASILFYLAYVPNETCSGNCNLGPQIGISETNDEVQQVIQDNNADVVSISYGIAEQYSDYVDNTGAYFPTGTEELQFAALQAEGIAVFVSSGDAGAQGCARPYYGLGPGVASPDQPCVSAPAIDPNVTSVGGITAPVDAAGHAIAPFTTWGVQTEGGYGATGGGLSTVVPLPSWQHGTGITGAFRNQPDMSLEADPTTGVSVAFNTQFSDGYFGGAGGTSVAAPEAAAMWALVLDACKKTPACVARGSGPHPYRLGNAGPSLYTIYNNAAMYPATFLDIVDGNNGVTPCLVNPGQVGSCPSPQPTPDPGFNAGVGYDLTTGIGVPFARHLIKAVVGV